MQSLLMMMQKCTVDVNEWASELHPINLMQSHCRNVDSLYMYMYIHMWFILLMILQCVMIQM